MLSSSANTVISSSSRRIMSKIVYPSLIATFNEQTTCAAVAAASNDGDHNNSNDVVFQTLTDQQFDTAMSLLQDGKRMEERRRAAVLVPLCMVGDDGPSILFTKRSPHLNHHASEISFPGGHKENNETPIDTALRETKEELLGDYPFDSDVSIVGTASHVPGKTGVLVTPVLATLNLELPSNECLMDVFPGDPNEVDTVFTVSVEELLDVERLQDVECIYVEAPVYETSQGKIWGLSATILRPMLHKIIKPTLRNVGML